MQKKRTSKTSEGGKNLLRQVYATVQRFKLGANVAGTIAPGVERQYLLIKARDTTLMLRYEYWLKAVVAVSGYQDACQAVRWYSYRWLIEFIFRDANQFTGLTDCQARDTQKLDFHFNASLTALILARGDAYQQHNTDEPFVFSMASYKHRQLNHHLLERFIHNLGLDETLIKSHPNYQSFVTTAF